MFTGIVTDVGKVRAIRETNRDVRMEIETNFDVSTIDMGASISHAGCCLTVVDKGEGWFAVEVSGETRAMSTLANWREGRRVNLERPARVGDEQPPTRAIHHALSTIFSQSSSLLLKMSYASGASSRRILWVMTKLGSI